MKTHSKTRWLLTENNFKHRLKRVQVKYRQLSRVSSFLLFFQLLHLSWLLYQVKGRRYIRNWHRITLLLGLRLHLVRNWTHVCNGMKRNNRYKFMILKCGFWNALTGSWCCFNFFLLISTFEINTASRSDLRHVFIIDT